jgi:hypothetical protein
LGGKCEKGKKKEENVMEKEEKYKIRGKLKLKSEINVKGANKAKKDV